VVVFNSHVKYFLKLIIFAVGFYSSHLFSMPCASHAWASVEYLYWWAEDSPIGIPLITQNNNPAALGSVGEPGTQVIFGAGSNRNSFNFDGLSGARVTLGDWFDDSHAYGIEGSGFGLAEASNSFTASSVGGGTINIPFNSTTKGEDALVDHLPNIVTASDNLTPWGLELNGLFKVSNHYNFPLYFLAGFRYINLSENFALSDAIFDNPSLPANAVLNVKDNFSTRNNFYGLQIGSRANFSCQKFIFDITALIAAGENYQKLIISGQTDINNTTIIQPFGLFSEPSNVGSFSNKQFAIVPEFRAKMAYEASQTIRPFFTYNVFYINKTIRPANQIDRNINQSQNPAFGGSGALIGPAVPAVSFHSNSMWMQGVSAGVEFVF